jgi:hypothetical protein
MSSDPNFPKKKTSRKRIILFSVAVVLLAGGIIFYLNFNKMLATALQKAFQSTLVADVYELNFENLRVNPIDGDISVLDVTFQPKATPRNNHSYINSTIHLKTSKLILKNADILLLLRANKLKLEKISIIQPDMELDVNGYNPIFFPFKESTPTERNAGKKQIDSYFLAEFQLIDASFKLVNSTKKRDFFIENFNISFKELLLDKNDQEDLFFLKEMDISLKKFTGNLEDDPLKSLSFSDFTLKFDSVDSRKNLDTLIFHFKNFKSQINELDIQTRDSLFHLMMGSFDLSYRNQSIQLEKLSFKPNVSNAVIQKNYKFQHTQFSGSVGLIDFIGVDFDSMLYFNSFYIEEVSLDSISALIYKDNTKAKDLNHFPEYLGQSVMGLTSPLRINTLKATHIDLVNEERKPDGDIARVKVGKGSVEAKNITNMAPNGSLSLNAVAYLANQVPLKLDLNFSYSVPQFTFNGVLQKFNLTDLNPIIEAYTPAKFISGVADEIKFSGIAQKSSSTGNLTFLYHDLHVKLELEEKAKWKSDIITFGANTALNTNNPASPSLPPREVKFKADRDMNKGFVNLIIKSILDGMKETMIMSKENRKEFNRAKKEARKEAKKEEPQKN